MKINLFKILAVAGLSIASTTVFAQYSGWKFNEKTHAKKQQMKLFQRLEIGFHSAFHETFFDNSLVAMMPIIDGGNQAFVEMKDFSINKLNTSNFGGNIGITIPVGRLARKTSFGINLDVYATMSNYKFDGFKVWGIDADPTFDFKSTTINIPFGLDVKWGGQSTLSKDDWASVGFGAGIAPTIVMMDPSDFSKNNEMSVRPYLKAEFGFYTGIFWKLKGMVLFNSMTLGEYESGNPDNVTMEAPHIYQEIRTNGNTYMLGLSFNIGSFGWTRSW